MNLQPLTVECPSCGSTDITYTCEPQCCFNHICATCYTTFELFTETVGKALDDVDVPTQEHDSLAPTVACACCKSLDIYVVEPTDEASRQLLCMSCRALLKLGFAAVECR